jgi:hypothetical protein
MGRDWYEPRDKGPQVEEREKHHKKKGEKKPFILQARYIGPVKNMAWLDKIYAKQRVWHTHRRYKTAKQRDEALRSLRHRAANSHAVYAWYEYRNEPDT